MKIWTRFLKTLIVTLFVFIVAFYLAIFLSPNFLSQAIQNKLGLYDNEIIGGLRFSRPANWMVRAYKPGNSNFELINGLVYDPRSLYFYHAQEYDYYRVQNTYIQYVNVDTNDFLEASVPSQENISALKQIMNLDEIMSPQNIKAENQLPKCISQYSGFLYQSTKEKTNLMFIKDYSVLISTDRVGDICKFNKAQSKQEQI